MPEREYIPYSPSFSPKNVLGIVLSVRTIYGEARSVKPAGTEADGHQEESGGTGDAVEPLLNFDCPLSQSAPWLLQLAFSLFISCILLFIFGCAKNYLS